MRYQPNLARWMTPLAVIALAYLVFAVFFPVLGFECVDLDLPSQVTRNPCVRSLTGENLRRIFTTWGNGGTTSSYYPIRTLSYAIDCQLWGPAPISFEPIDGWKLTINGFKLTNVLIHLANVLLVFWLVLRLFRRGRWADRSPKAWWEVAVATFAGGVFAVHPVVVEPVAWVPGREELLMTLGALGCLHFHLTARRLEQRGGKTRKAIACYAAAALCCAAACLSNAVAAVIPLLITAWDVLTLSRPRLWRILYGTSVLWLMGLATIAVKEAGTRKDLLTRPLEADQAAQLSAVIQKLGYGSQIALGEVEGAPAERLMMVLNVFWLNLKTLLWPTKVGMFYEPVTARSFLETDVMLGAAAVALACAALWLLRRRKRIVFGLVWFGLALGPTSQIMPHHIHRADRFLYLPLAGLAVAAAMGLRPLAGLLKRRAALGGLIAAGGLGLFLLVTLSAWQVLTWRNTISMWENSVKVAPKNFLSHHTLAQKLAYAGQFDRAFKHYEIALAFNTFHVEALNEFAGHLAGCDDKQLRDYELAIRLANWAGDLSQWKNEKVVHTLALAYNNYAVELGDRRQFGRAIDYYHKAFQTEPQYAAPRFNLALLLATCSEARFRDPDEAVRLAEQACQVGERPNANYLMILAIAYAEAGRADMAVSTTQKAIRRAEAEGNAELAKLLRARLKLYQKSLRSASSGD